MKENPYLSRVSLAICAVLYFVWPTIHTMALTKLMLVCGAVVGVLLWIRSADRKGILKSSWFIYSALLMAWVVLHAAFISQNGNEAWGELRGQWLPAYLAMLAGIGCALAGRQISPRSFGIYLLAVLAAQPTFYLFETVIKSLQTGHLAMRYWGASDHKMSLTFYADLLAATACARVIDEVKSEVVQPRIYLWLLPIALAFYVAIFAESLNGLILLIGCSTLTAILWAWHIRNKISNNVIIITAVLAMSTFLAIGTSSYMVTKWHTFTSDTKVAIDIDTYKDWQHYGRDGQYILPINERGEQVKESYYLRVAYATAGLRAIIENPWGYGVTRRAFERLVQINYPEARITIANSHNGYIDLVSAVGFPALLLLAMAVASVLKQIRKSGSEWARPAVWTIGVVLANWAIDPVSRDHYFETFLFLIGLLSVLTMESKTDNARSS